MRWILALFLALQALASTAYAQEAPDAAEAHPLIEVTITGEAAEAILARFSDAELRAALVKRGDEAAAQTETDERSFLERIETGALNVAVSLWTSVSRITVIPGVLAECYAAFAAERPWHLAQFSGMLLLALGVAGAVAWGLGWLLRGRRERTAAAQPEGLRGRVRVLLQRAALDLLLVVSFYVVARALATALFETPTDLATASTIIRAFALLGAVRLGLRFVLSPGRPELRLVHAEEVTARFLNRRILVIAFISLFGRWLLEWTFLFGAEPGHARLGFWINFAMMALIADTLWRARAGLSAMMIGDGVEMTAMETRIARLWPDIAAVLVLLLWVSVEAIVANVGVIAPLREGAQATTLLLIVLIPVFHTAIRSAAALAAPQPSIDEPPGLTEARRITRRGLVRVGGVVTIALMLLFVMRLWGLDPQALAESALGAQVLTQAFAILTTLLIAYGALEAIEIAYGRQIAFDEASRPAVDPDEPGGGEGGGAGGTRAGTVAPLLRGAGRFFVFAFTVFAILAELGLNVTALVAGAGVVGLAIGFGAQTLVRDIVSGVFFLLDDAFRKGEYIEIGETRGTVEKISVRSLRLRHHRGAVHTIPYGEIAKLTNYSRDWSIMKLSFRVPFDADVDKIRKLFKQIGRELLKDPEIGDDFIQPFKSQGVTEVDDSAIIVRGKFMTKPGKQFTARKKVYVAVQQAFHENGIPFARKEVRVHMPGLDENDPPEIRRGGAAAASHEVTQPPPEPQSR